MGQQRIIESNKITLPESGAAFCAYGHFYTLTGFEKEPDFDPETIGPSYFCRSQLVIVREGTRAQKSIEVNPRRALPPDFRVDALVIMMNPGSSKPSPPYDVGEPQVHFSRIGKMHATFVPTQPDPTQIQVVRVMEKADYDGVIVANLSDLRSADSRKFLSKFRNLEMMDVGGVHSIFCPTRENEVKRLVRICKPDAPVICAWGVYTQLWPLIIKCLTALEKGGIEAKDLIGLRPPPVFYHPRAPIPENWIEGITTQLAAAKRAAASR